MSVIYQIKNAILQFGVVNSFICFIIFIVSVAIMWEFKKIYCLEKKISFRSKFLNKLLGVDYKNMKKNGQKIQDKIIDDDMAQIIWMRKKNLQILEDLDSFVKGSYFLKKVAIREGQTIFDYVFNKQEGSLYKFDKFILDNKEVGVDAERLCFSGLQYIRVSDVTEFLTEYFPEIENHKLGNPNTEDGGAGMNKELDFFKKLVVENNQEPVN